MFRMTALCCVCTFVSVSSALAEKNAEIAPKLAKLQSPTVTETFDSPLSKVMSGVKGEWTVADGVLVGKELASDKHAAVLNYQKSNRNSVVRFSFKLDGETNGFNFSLNHAKGHLFRVTVTPNGMSVNLDKDKNDPASKAVAMGSAKAKFEQGVWYTMQIEMIGDRAVAQVDNGASVEVSSPAIDVEKPNYRFVTKGDSLSLDDLHIWELK